LAYYANESEVTKTAGLLVTDPAQPAIRPTDDVDLLAPALWPEAEADTAAL
jgi:hypothetical protein